METPPAHGRIDQSFNRNAQQRTSHQHRLLSRRRAMGIARRAKPGYRAGHEPHRTLRPMAMIRALQLLADRQVAVTQIDAPAPPAPDEVQLRVRVVGLNHIDVWGYRGMAFAKRQYPLTVGAEAAGEIAAAGPEVTGLREGQRVIAYSGLTCGHCRACREGRENLCENVAGIRGF